MFSIFRQLINMSKDFCLCLLKFHSNPASIAYIVLELVLVLVIIVFGTIINLKFRTKLEDEKKQTPAGRRGNVIAPVMNVFCIIQVVFWPFDLFLIWGTVNEVVPVDLIDPWLCKTLFLTLKCGRICIAYNSLMVALIRYIHIVHDRVSNQWNYERAAKVFKLASIFVPVVMEVIGSLTDGFNQFAEIEEIRDCTGYTDQLSTSNRSEEFMPGTLVNWTMNYVPLSLIKTIYYTYIVITVVVSMNIVEAYLYKQIFDTMKRYYINHKSITLQ